MENKLFQQSTPHIISNPKTQTKEQCTSHISNPKNPTKEQSTSHISNLKNPTKDNDSKQNSISLSQESKRNSNLGTNTKESFEITGNQRISLEKQIEKLQHPSSDDFDVHKISFKRLSHRLASIGPLHINNFEEFLAKSKVDFDKLFSDNTKCNLSISDFTIVKHIGKGAFGKVVLAEFSLDETLYAIKLIEKREVLKKSLVRYVINEKRVLQSVNFPFVVQLKYFFVDYKYMYFVMPFIPGGDFNYYLFKQKLLNESHARFYIGQLILALEYLHYMGLIHRDVKPENIIIDVFGYLKLGDFGQCVKCFDNDKTWTIAGTPDYMAPEVIVGKGYDCAVDWWSLGVVTFQTCAGQLPFASKDIDGLYKLILTVKYHCPEHFSRHLRSFVKGLLVNNSSDRIANRSKRATKLKTMSWLKGVNWLGLLNRTLQAPYLPDVSEFSTENLQRKIIKQ